MPNQYSLQKRTGAVGVKSRQFRTLDTFSRIQCTDFYQQGKWTWSF